MSTRRMLLVDHFRGLIEANVTSDEVASAIGRHHAAIRRYLETGDCEPLRPFVARWFPVEGGEFIPETNPGHLTKHGRFTRTGKRALLSRAYG